MKLHHIGVITRDLQKCVSIYTKLGYTLKGGIVSDEIQFNRIAMMESAASPYIELIEPINQMSSIYHFKAGYHHLCYEADRGEDIIGKFKEMKIGKIFTKPISAPALDGKTVVFACLQDGTFMELII